MTDSRALLLAAAAWVGSFAAWWSGGAAVVLLAGVAVVAAATRRSVWFWPAMAMAVALSAGVGTALLARGGATPADDAVGVYLQLSAQTTSSTKQIRSTASGRPRVVVAVDLQHYSSAAGSWDSSLPVRIFGPADGWHDLPVGSTIDFRGRLATLEPGAAAVFVSASGAPQRVVAPQGIDQWPASMRAALARALDGDDEDAASLVAGLAIGDETGQSPDFADEMQLSGLSHLTAVSGGNVAIVLAVAVMAARLVGLRLRPQAVAAAVALAGYVILVGPQPSVLRAAAMGAVGLVGILRGGAPRGLPVLGSCVLVLVLASPGLSVSLGFALSVVATASLIAVAPPLLRILTARPWLRRAPEPLLLALVVTISAQAATAPLLLAIGAPVSWVAVPANLAAAPLVAPITVLGLTAAVAGVAIPAAASAASAAAIALAGFLVGIARWAAEHSTDEPLSGPGTAVAAAALAVMLILAAGRRRCRVSALPHPAAVGLPVLIAVLLLPESAAPGEWRVIACDVEQGTAVLLRDGADGAILIDAGPDNSAAASCVAHAGVRRLSAVVITHFHADHYGGLADVLARTPVDEIITTGFSRPTAGADMVSREAVDRGVPIRQVAAGDTIGLADTRATVLWPPAGFAGGDEEANNSSIVARVVWPDGFSVMTTGDIEHEAQSALMGRAGPGPPADVVIVPHHGSDNQDPEFAAWARSAVAVASCGDNTYGHPAPQTMAEYESAGTVAMRTDTGGSVAVGLDGDQLTLNRSE